MNAKELWENVVEPSARENAQHTEAEGYNAFDKLNHTAVWAFWVFQSALSVIDSLTGHECVHYQTKRPIGDRTAKALRKMAKAAYGNCCVQYPTRCRSCTVAPAVAGYSGKCSECWHEAAIDGVP